jgi:hypothetical protein
MTTAKGRGFLCFTKAFALPFPAYFFRQPGRGVKRDKKRFRVFSSGYNKWLFGA